MQDWGSAQYLINRAYALPLSSKEKEEISSMQQYLTTQSSEQPQDDDEEEASDPREKMFKAMAELKYINGGMYDLYAKAISKGVGTFSALSSLMYNRCWCHNKHVLDNDDEARLREQAKEDTKEVVKHGHGRGYENNYVPGYGDPSIRDYKHGEWSPQVLHIGNDAGAQSALVAKCETQQSNYSFKYWTTLIPEGLSYSQHQYIVYKLNWRIKSGLRAGGPISEETVKLAKSTKKPGKSSGAALSIAA